MRPGAIFAQNKTPGYMGKLDNEIVKFIAEVELDPQTAAQYQQNLADTEKHNEALRKSISETVRKMEEMRVPRVSRTPRSSSACRHPWTPM